MVSDAEWQAQVAWNATGREHGAGGYAKRFEAQAAHYVTRVAARHGDEEISYAALNAIGNRVGWALQAHGVEAGDLVGVYAERGLGLLSLVVGVLKAGAVYVPLDVRHPWERSQQILLASGARVVLTTDGRRDGLVRGLAAVALGERPEVIALEEIAGGAYGEANLGMPVHPAQLAYVIYTSGSTGVPKGAMVTLAGMLNNQLSKIPYIRIDG